MKTEVTVFDIEGAVWTPILDNQPPSAPTVKKMRASAKLNSQRVYPIFEELSEFTTDPFWLDVFMNMSQNVFRKGFRYYPPSSASAIGKLVYKTRTKEFVCDMPFFEDGGSGTIAIDSSAFDYVKSFMVKHARMVSEADQQNARRDAPIQNAAEILRKWSDVKNVTMRIMFVGHFIDNLMKRTSITSDQYSNLVFTLNLAAMSDSIMDHNVDLYGGKIKAIHGVMRDPDGHFCGVASLNTAPASTNTCTLLTLSVDPPYIYPVASVVEHDDDDVSGPGSSSSVSSALSTGAPTVTSRCGGLSQSTFASVVVLAESALDRSKTHSFGGGSARDIIHSAISAPALAAVSYAAAVDRDAPVDATVDEFVHQAPRSLTPCPKTLASAIVIEGEEHVEGVTEELVRRLGSESVASFVPFALSHPVSKRVETLFSTAAIKAVHRIFSRAQTIASRHTVDSREFTSCPRRPISCLGVANTGQRRWVKFVERKSRDAAASKKQTAATATQ